jgi:SRSO17 transposase
MKAKELRKLERELTTFVEEMTDNMGRLERRQALGQYVRGLLLDGERKSIEPMAARLVDDASEISAMRQRMQQAVVVAEWADDEMRARLACKLERELPGVEAFVIDDTGFPKKGKLSVGVARQYSGTLGRTDNCQVATSLHLAGERGSGCVGMQLYLPEEWAQDPKRRAKAGVPDNVPFMTKWQIGLGLLEVALDWGVRKHVVLADAGYGDAVEFRDGVAALGLKYLVGVTPTHLAWPLGSKPKLPLRTPGSSGRPQTRYRDGGRKPVSMKELVLSLGRGQFRTVTWREGSEGSRRSRFAALRIRSAEGHTKGRPPSDEQWLLSEWPRGEPEPTKYWLSSLSAATSLKNLVRQAKLRWRVERDYQELKQEIGLDHYEGRTWRGFHHHATLCAAAHGFLAIRRALFPPEPGSVDPADGSSAPSASAAATDRNVSALSPTC